MSGVPFGPAARIAPIKGADEAQNQLQRQSSQKFGVPSSPPRAVKSFEQVYKPATAPDHPCSRPSTTDTQASVVSGPGELLCDYYSTTEALVEYLVCLLEEPVVAGFDQRPTLPANVQDVASIPSLPELKACDATCREWLAHHGLLYATPGHSSYAVIYDVIVSLLEFLAAHNWGLLPDPEVCKEWTAHLLCAKRELGCEVDAEALRAASDAASSDVLSL